MTQLTTDILASPEIPEDAKRLHIMKFSQPQTFSYEYSIVKGNGKSQSGLIAMIDLPPGNWEYLFCTKDATGKDIAITGIGSGACQQQSRKEFNKILKSKGLNPEKNFAILKRLI